MAFSASSSIPSPPSPRFICLKKWTDWLVNSFQLIVAVDGFNPMAVMKWWIHIWLESWTHGGREKFIGLLMLLLLMLNIDISYWWRNGTGQCHPAAERRQHQQQNGGRWKEMKSAYLESEMLIILPPSPRIVLIFWYYFIDEYFVVCCWFSFCFRPADALDLLMR